VIAFHVGGWPLTLRLAALLAATVPLGLSAAEESSGQRPRDAAEAVREGDVSQWLKYYQRERALQVPAQQPAPATAPAIQSTPSGKPAPQSAPGEEPPTQQQEEDAATGR
jgi:hypothetical protein